MSLKAKIKQYGFKNSLRRAVKSILRKIGINYESFYLMVNQINIEELNLIMEKYDYSDVKELTFDDFKLGNPAVFTPLKMELIKYRFESGKYCAYGIVDAGFLAYSTWISRDEINFNSIRSKSFLLMSNQALLEDSYCHYNYRGLRLHTKMNLYRLKKIYEMGYVEAIAIVLKENVPAIRTQIKSGFKNYDNISFIKLFKKVYFIK